MHADSNFDVFGIVDDVWGHTDGSLAIVDYKATSTPATLSLDGRHGYMRQIELSQWLFRRNGFTVSSDGYFVFVNASRDRDMFDRILEFSMQILSHAGSDAWVEDALIAARECLMGGLPPPYVETCAWCAYRRAAREE